jgi:hypothetical protein
VVEDDSIPDDLSAGTALIDDPADGVDPGLLLVLPPGYRPQRRVHLITRAHNNVMTRIDIHPTGEVALVNGHATSWNMLDGIAFVAEQ